MPSLSRLDMRVNNLTAGSIEVYNSSTPSRLEYLYLGPNNFEGKVIEPVSKFINLKVAAFPNVLKNFEKLETIALSDNRIEGKLPEWLWNLLMCRVLTRLSNCKCTVKYAVVMRDRIHRDR
uniref:Leucine-rich repeat-containing N-terminal plant-type domain-containing protein n=1 Tax=Brassica oleracea var. oleracea TaxID=109376 RepID=A0A0D3C3R4_BRAOL